MMLIGLAAPRKAVPGTVQYSTVEQLPVQQLSIQQPSVPGQGMRHPSLIEFVCFGPEATYIPIVLDMLARNYPEIEISLYRRTSILA